MLSLLSVFELDGNATTTTSHDWDQVFADNQAVPPTKTSGAVASSFVTDAVNSSKDDIFQGGGSKDTLGIQAGKWLFTNSKPQPKDDITHAFAAAYTDPSNGHLILYAGLDRFDNSGDATAGFWFFKNPIGENAAVTTNGGHPFVGAHADGDILLVSDFTVGGSTSTIKVFRWTGDDATGKLVALNNGNPIGGSTFADVNGGPISVPWSYTNKAGSHSPAAGEFLEEGVDLTALGIQGCFSSFLAETRSSQSPTATLSDFVVGSFPLCSLAATPFTGLSKVGDSITYPLTVKNTGAMPLYIQSVSESLLGNIVVNHTLQQPGAAGVNPAVTAINAGGYDFTQPLAPGASLTILVTRTVQSGDPDPTTSTVTFTGTDDLAGQEDPITASAVNSVNLFQPSATMTVTASPTTASSLGQVITYTYTVRNTSSADSPNLVLSTSDPNNSFTDTLLGNLEADAIAAGGGSLAPGASFSFTETRAIQAGDPSPLTNTANVIFTLAQNLGSFSNRISASSSASVTLLPHLNITKAVTPGSPDVIHPGDTASFTITVTNDGAGPATNVVVTDQLPEAALLNWTVASSTFGATSISTGDFLTASTSSLAAGASVSVTVSAAIPADIFGTTGSGNGHPLPGGLFELDGNAVDAAGVAGDDWSNVLFGNGGSSVAHSFVTDAVNTTQDDIFQGGGSKDTLGIQAGPWLYTGSKPQAKDDITHAFAATYTDPATGDVILYAGLDRYDNSGAATAGFWFFQNPIKENAAVTTNGGHPFIGTHADGDILLVSDFTVGGSVSTIKVFRWTGDDVNGSLVPVATPPNSTFAIVNSGTISVPWSYMNKSRATSPAAGEFLEEGVNLSALGLGGCFSNFLAETRSSQSPTATLSDFVIGSFNTCTLNLPNTATVQATGVAPITSNQVVITVNDGDALLADSLGGGTATAGLTAEQLQAAVAQGIGAWRGAGVDPRVLSGLDTIAVHVADLPGAELGFASPGAIWIDRTAAGWGWTPDGAPGGMDLPTVVAHELGHLLGFEHDGGAGLMAPTLESGARLGPAAVLGAGSGSLSSTDSSPGVSPLGHSDGAAMAATGLLGRGGALTGVADNLGASGGSLAPTSAPAARASSQVTAAGAPGIATAIGSTPVRTMIPNGTSPGTVPSGGPADATGRIAALRPQSRTVLFARPRRADLQPEGHGLEAVPRDRTGPDDGGPANLSTPVVPMADFLRAVPETLADPSAEDPSPDAARMPASQFYFEGEDSAGRSMDGSEAATPAPAGDDPVNPALEPIAAAAAFAVGLSLPRSLVSRASHRGWGVSPGTARPGPDVARRRLGRASRWLSLSLGRTV